MCSRRGLGTQVARKAEWWKGSGLDLREIWGASETTKERKSGSEAGQALLPLVNKIAMWDLEDFVCFFFPRNPPQLEQLFL